MSGTTQRLSNPLLQQVEQQIESNLAPEIRESYMKVVVAGLHVSLAKGRRGGMASLIRSKDPVSDAAMGAVALVLSMRKQSKGVMPLKAMVQAGMTLMLHALDFIDRAKVARIAEPQLDQASRIYANTLFARLRITPAMLQHATGRVHQMTQDPAIMAKINMKAGFLRHPMSVTPTPLPPGGPPGLINGASMAAQGASVAAQ